MKQKIVIAGLAVALFPVVVMAAAPVGFDGWSVNSGTIDTSTSCGVSGVSCSTMAADNGFVEEKVVVNNYEYIRLVVTEAGATGDTSNLGFSTEFFLPFATASAGVSQGVASKQIVRDTAEGFTSQAELQRAMMRFRDPSLVTIPSDNGGTLANEMWSVRLHQDFARTDMTSSFDFTDYTSMYLTAPAAMPDTDTVIGYTMAIAQNMPMNPDGTANIDPNAKQHFETRKSSGYMGNIICPTGPFNTWCTSSNYYASAPITPVGNMTLGGTTVNWAEAATVSTTWLAQTDMFDASKVSTQFQSVTDLDTSATASQTSTSGASAPVQPFSWDEPTFGLTPSFP